MCACIITSHKSQCSRVFLLRFVARSRAAWFTPLASTRRGNPVASRFRRLNFPSMFYLSGNIRRFRRVCEHIQSQVCSRSVGINLGGQSRAAPPSPRASRKFTTEMSESSSCGSDTSERLFLSPHPATRQVVCFNKVVHRHLPPPSHHCRDNSFLISQKSFFVESNYDRWWPSI